MSYDLGGHTIQVLSLAAQPQRTEAQQVADRILRIWCGPAVRVVKVDGGPLHGGFYEVEGHVHAPFPGDRVDLVAVDGEAVRGRIGRITRLWYDARGVKHWAVELQEFSHEH